MNKFEQILRKHFVGLAQQSTRIAPNTAPASSCNCCIPETTQLSIDKICAAVKQLSGSAGIPGSNPCAKDIKTNNNNPCETKKFTKGDIIIAKCQSYANSVVAALPQNATPAQRAEASRKAECDCLNNAISGTPSVNNLGFSPAVMGKQILDFYTDGCSYVWISKVCGEREKVLARKALPHLIC